MPFWYCFISSVKLVTVKAAVTVGPCVGLLPENSVCVGLCSSYSWPLRRVTTGKFCLCWFVLWPLGVAALVAQKTPALCDG
jgi:uncharacterized membrane protein YczE